MSVMEAERGTDVHICGPLVGYFALFYSMSILLIAWGLNLILYFHPSFMDPMRFSDILASL